MMLLPSVAAGHSVMPFRARQYADYDDRRGGDRQYNDRRPERAEDTRYGFAGGFCSRARDSGCCFIIDRALVVYASLASPSESCLFCVVYL
jgi:hypothetical protein